MKKTNKKTKADKCKSESKYEYKGECKCECGNQAKCFHSNCCQAHFEGIIKNNKQYIACENCGEILGELR